MATKSKSLSSAWELLKEAWGILIDHTNILLPLVAILYIPFNLFMYYVLSSQTVDTADLATYADLGNQVRLLGILESLLGMAVVIAGIYIVGMVKKQKKTKKVSSFNELASVVGSNYKDFFFTNFRMTVFLIGLFLLFIIPGIIYSVFWAFTGMAVVLMGLAGNEALKKSKSLVEGRWFSVFGYLFAIGFVGLLAMALAGVPSAFVPQSIGWFSAITDVLVDYIALLPVMAVTLLFLELDAVGPKNK